MSNLSNVSQIRENDRHFRILVIGRANAGKTTLLKRVCNATEDPCICGENGKNLLEPTDERGIHDIRRPFNFSSHPGFIFHDSPGFEAGDDRQLKEVQSFIDERARATDVADQLNAIWFCFIPNLARPLLKMEERFFNKARAGNVPVVAIFTKFDDIIAQTFDMDLEWEENRRMAERELQDKFQTPLSRTRFPPSAYVRTEDLHDDNNDHWGQVKELINKTADSLDDATLQMLWVSVRKNLEVPIRSAITYSFQALECYPVGEWIVGCLERFPLVYIQDYDAIASFLYPKFNPSYTLVAALLICTENSFWWKEQSKAFIDAFQQAYSLYVETGTKEIVGKAVHALERLHNDEKSRRFTDIILNHRLPHPN